MTKYSLSQGLVVKRLTPAAQQLGMQSSMHCAKYQVPPVESCCSSCVVEDLPILIQVAVHKCYVN